MSALFPVQLAGSGVSLAASGVGIADAAGSTIGASSIGIAGLTVTTGLATLGIGAGLAVLIMELFKGANPLQVPAAKAEQIYEVAADNMLSLEKAGIITEAQSVAGMQALITAGQQEEASLQSQIGTPAVKGSTNLTNVIQAEIVDAEGVSPLPALLTGVTLQEAEAHYYINPSNENGWYPQSVTDADAVTDQLATQFIAQNQTTITAASAASAASSPTSQSAATAAAQTTGTNATTTTAASLFSTSTGHTVLLVILGIVLWRVVSVGQGQ
ncbi:MAG TPA: hypothetical protein VGY31_03505 [Terriglobia bacterium]|nr:hypothetical protein [Terriglobia bacterium]